MRGRLSHPSRFTLLGKRAIDIMASLAGLMILSPLLIVAIVIATFDTRTVGIFSQKRVGRGGREFTIYKVRTMRRGADERGSVTTSHDPRVTSLGRLFRKSKVDELPQLWNVLIGDMSLVGPRPTVASDYERMSESQRCRSLVRPGITGLAQISGNTSLDWPDRIRLDLAYIEELSIAMDLRILLKTIAMTALTRIETHPASADEWGADDDASDQ